MNTSLKNIIKEIKINHEFKLAENDFKKIIADLLKSKNYGIYRTEDGNFNFISYDTQILASVKKVYDDYFLDDQIELAKLN